MTLPRSLEICAGAGGQAIGLSMAGFEHAALVEYEPDYCEVLRENRPDWNVLCTDVREFDGRPYRGIDLLSGGVPCPPVQKGYSPVPCTVQILYPAQIYAAGIRC